MASRFEPTTDHDLTRSKNLPVYPEDFGHLAESIMADALARAAGSIIEKVEKGTPNEDIRKKVDFWVKLREIDEPIGVQFTCSKNLDKIQDKKDFLRINMKNAARKDFRPEAEIKWSEPAPVVLVEANREGLAKAWKQSQETGKSPAEFIGDEMVRDVLAKMIYEVGQLDPKKIKAIHAVLEKAKKEKGTRKSN